MAVYLYEYAIRNMWTMALLSGPLTCRDMAERGDEIPRTIDEANAIFEKYLVKFAVNTTFPEMAPELSGPGSVHEYLKYVSRRMPISFTSALLCFNA